MTDDFYPESDPQATQPKPEKIAECYKAFMAKLNVTVAECIRLCGRMAKGIPYSAPANTQSDIGRLISELTDEETFSEKLRELHDKLQTIRFGGEHVVVIDDLQHGFGMLIVTGFKTAKEAREWGHAFQKREGDYPCWNAITLRPDRTPFTMNILQNDQANPMRAGVWIRRIYRESSSEVGSVNLIGPFENTDVMKGFVLRDITARRSEEWQEVSVNLKMGPRVISKERFAEVYRHEYFTDDVRSGRIGQMDLAMRNDKLLNHSVSAIDLKNKGRALLSDEHPLLGYI